MATTVDCRRCRQRRPGLEAPPLNDKLGAEIVEQVCAACWQEWEETEVKVINELRLNFMDPESERILRQHLREFLSLGDAAEGGAD